MARRKRKPVADRRKKEAEMKEEQATFHDIDKSRMGDEMEEMDEMEENPTGKEEERY